MTAEAVALDLSRIGCSDLPILAGVDPYAEPIDLFNRIVRGYEPERSREQNEMGELGKLYEMPTVRFYAEHRRTPSTTAVSKPPSITPQARPWQRYSLDAVLGMPTSVKHEGATPQEIVECKLRNTYSAQSQGWGEDGDPDGVPIKVRVQVQGQLEAVRADRDAWVGTDVPDLDEATVLCSVNGQSLRIFTVPRNEDLGAALVEAAERFWRDHVLTQTPPPLEWGEGTHREMLRAYPEPTYEKAEPRQATWGEHALAGQLKDINAELKHLKSEKRQIELQLMAAVGEHYAINGDGWRATWFTKQPSGTHNQIVKELAKRARINGAQRDRLVEWHRAALISTLKTLAGVNSADLEQIEDSFRGKPTRELRVTWKEPKR